MVSAPPARSDDNSLEEAFTVGVRLDAWIVGKCEVDFASRGRSQRPQRNRRAPAKGLIGRRLGPLLQLMCATLLEAVAVKVDRAVIRETPVQNPVAEILEGIEASPPRSSQEMKISPLELALQRLIAVGKMGGDLELATAKGLR